MDPQLQQLLTAHAQLFVQQKKEWPQILLNWEAANKYAVLDASQRPIGFIGERGGGIWMTLKRWILRTHRPFHIDVFSAAGQQLLSLSRSFFWFFSDLTVQALNGPVLGSAHRRFGILYKKYDLRDANGNLFATISSPIWRLWTFPIADPSGTERAVITKKWGGVVREVLTDADTYLIDFAAHPWTLEQRAVIFAAAISIDFDFFENNQGQRSGLFSFIPD